MPKQIVQLNDFSGGLNTEKDIADIASNEVGVAENVMFNVYGSVQPAYSMKQTANKISGYQNTNIQSIEPGYGLGYFETDRTRDGVTVSVTSSIQGQVDITDGSVSGTPNGFVALKHNTDSIFKELMYYSSGSQQNLANSFPVGSKIIITGVSFTGLVMTEQGQGIYSVVEHNGNNIILNRKIKITPGEGPTINDQNFWGATIAGGSFGDQLILLANPSTHKIDVFSKDAFSWTSNVITLRNAGAQGQNSKVIFYKGGDNIRCIDTADNSDCTIEWYGYIQRTHFKDLSNSKTSASQSFSDYYAKDNNLEKPDAIALTTAIVANTDSIANHTSYPSLSSEGFKLQVNTVQQDGAIPKGTLLDPDGSSATYEYEFAQTFIYDGNQESLPTKYTNSHNTGDNDLKQLSINVSAKAPYDQRISGGRIYARPKNSNEEYIMVLDIDLTKGCRTKLSNDYTKWHDAGSNQYNCPTATGSGDFIITEFGLLTYEVLNGYSSSVFSNYIGSDGETYKDVVVANNRAFVCNVTMVDENTGVDKDQSFDRAALKRFPDRIMYSMPNRFDTFPYHNFIEAAVADSDVYIALESYADRLLAYKTKSLDIINISGDDRNWFLEDSKEYQGVLHREAVKKTQYGVIWVNQHGLHLYNGQSITNLKDNKISDSTWSSHVTSNSSIIYDEQESMAFVVKNMASDGDAYMVDLRKGNFTLIKDFVNVANDGVTNSVDTESNNTLIAADTGSSTDIYQFNRVVISAVGKLTTKAIDFGSTHQIKKVYAVYVTYKSDIDITDSFSLLEENGSEHDLGQTIPASSANWSTIKLTPPSPVVCNKLSIKFNASGSSKVYINDIAIEYRLVYKKGS